MLGTLKAAGFAGLAGYRRTHPYYDLWVVGTRSPKEAEELKSLLAAHQPV